VTSEKHDEQYISSKLNGKFKGEDVLLPRIPMITTDMPFEFKRLLFPVRLAFAMTINKAQGQSLKVCG
jgi:ATP-dependent DNA helicase PIF1